VFAVQIVRRRRRRWRKRMMMMMMMMMMQIFEVISNKFNREYSVLKK
jgi:hypothetical protein